MGRGRIAGAPTPDIWGRKAGRGRRLQAYGYAPALQGQSVASRRMGSGPYSWGPNPRHIPGVGPRHGARPSGARKTSKKGHFSSKKGQKTPPKVTHGWRLPQGA
eukprot:gene20602-biopygen11613